MDARGISWGGGSGQNLPMPVLRELAASEIRRLTRRGPRPPRNPLLLAMGGFIRWCILKRGINDGHDVTPGVAKDFKVMLRRAGVKRRVWELHRDAVAIVLDAITASRGVWHPDRSGHLHVPTAGEIWECPDREFGAL